MVLGHSSSSSSGYVRQTGVKRPRSEAFTGAPSSDAMPPPQPRSQQQGPSETGRESLPSSASAQHPSRSGRAASMEGKPPTATVADVCWARRHALPAISSALSGNGAGRCTGTKRGCADGGAPAAQQGSGHPPPTQRSSCTPAANTSNNGDAGGGGGSSGTLLRTATTITVSRVLQLGHGAITRHTPPRNSSSRGEGSRWSPEGEGSSAGEREVEVVLGLLVFESLREGDVAVSSLFLQDETGER